MITGSVSHERAAIVQLTVLGISGDKRVIEAAIDTGFTGYLALPTNLINDLGPVWLQRRKAILGDGTARLFDVFEISVEWDGEILTIPVYATDAQSLIGMSLLYGHDLHIQVIDGGTVTIVPL
jgi:clan AA aspartic protease